MRLHQEPREAEFYKETKSIFHFPTSLRQRSQLFWASDLRNADAFELVTPPIDEVESNRYIGAYDELLRKLNLGPGLKTSQQFNMELRELILGLGLSDRPSDKLGVATRVINSLNISRVVDLFLFCERNVLYIYAALAPKRLGNLVNYFAVPMLFEHLDLLKELAAMPESDRTYSRVRAVFLKYQNAENAFAKYGKRTAWKYRPFNIRKLFMLQQDNPTWVYPAMEVRVPDTPENSSEFLKMRDFMYATFKSGSLTKTTPQDLENLFADYRKFWSVYSQRLPFAKAVRILNQDIVSRSLTKEFRTGYKDFLQSLNLRSENYPAFLGAEPTANVSRSYMVYNQIGETISIEYAGRRVIIPKVEMPWDLSEYSFGAEFEFTEVPGLLDRHQNNGRPCTQVL